MLGFDAFLEAFDAHRNFAFTKINHGFWEAIGDVYAALGEPVPPERHQEADRIAGRPLFFEGGFVDELLALLRRAVTRPDPSLFMGFELSAWPNDNAIIGTPDHPERCAPVLERVVGAYGHQVDGLLLKRAVMSGEILALFERLRDRPVILVGPGYIEPLIAAAGLGPATFIPIHPSEARRDREAIEARLRDTLDGHGGGEVCVLFQAGTLAPYWILRLRDAYPRVRWVDGGLAFSIGSPEDILRRPWGLVYRATILDTYERLRDPRPIPRVPVFPVLPDNSAETWGHRETTVGVEFVERKSLDPVRFDFFLAAARRHNRWANRGPAWELLGRAYHRLFGQKPDQSVVACANGQVALAALAQLHAARAGRDLRWVVSAFGFANTNRGLFADSRVVDCDEHGLLDLDALAALDPRGFDGFVVTNPFGLARDFDRYIAFSQRTGKVMLIDNAAGIHPRIPDHPYQAFSLHHTKPFGFGEGGLVVVPKADRERLLGLLEYRPLADSERRFWVGNGKISELACAALLCRLESYPQWMPLYRMQRRRIQTIAGRAGLERLVPWDNGAVATSLPFLTPVPVPTARLENPLFTLGRYYKPLSALPRVTELYERMVNVPCHPGMAAIPSEAILETLRRLTGERA